jgi:hypothetical protein
MMLAEQAKESTEPVEYSTHRGRLQEEVIPGLAGTSYFCGAACMLAGLGTWRD